MDFLTHSGKIPLKLVVLNVLKHRVLLSLAFESVATCLYPPAHPGGNDFIDLEQWL
jgi:hypothetical protein